MDRLLLILSVLPVYIIATYIYKKDKNKESKKLIVKLFLGGIASCILTLALTFVAGLFSDLAYMDEGLTNIEVIIQMFVFVALIEEFSKWIFTYLISFKNEEFDEQYDMVLYAVYVSLGFAGIENILYVFDGGIITGVLRAILSVPGHAFDGVFMGYFLGLAKMASLENKKGKKTIYIILSILVPTIMHGIYDSCLSINSNLGLVIFGIYVVLTYIFGIKKIKHVAKNGKSFSIKKEEFKYKYCPNCGTPVNSKFCPNCGNRNE